MRVIECKQVKEGGQAMKPLWENDPAAWRAMPLGDQLEFLRKWYCTGPCGQSNSVLAARESLNAALKAARTAIASTTDLLAACRKALFLVEENNEEIVHMVGSFGLLADLQAAIAKGDRP